MKPVRMQLAASAVIFAIAFPALGQAGDFDSPSAGKGAQHSKAEYCSYCHGGFYTMPRLAGQTTEYLENQLRAFAELRRDRSIPIRMSRVHAMKPSMRSALAAHFNALNPPVVGRGSGEHSGLGKKIYEEGVPESNVPACVACHGPNAMGLGPSPRLAGQLSAYTQKQLLGWSRDRGQDPATVDTSAVMKSIAGSMTKTQVQAVSAYLNSLK
jgi:cytochrome c553